MVNIEKGIFRLVVVLSVLLGLATLISMRGNISNEYYYTKNELIVLNEGAKISAGSKLDMGDFIEEVVKDGDTSDFVLSKNKLVKANLSYFVKHKPIIIFLPIFWFLVGFLPIWIVYFMVYYVIKGFKQ
jgi:hypothetical protein